MKKKRPIKKGEAWFLLIVGLIMGTVFTIGVKYWDAPISYDETEQVSATFSSYEETTRRGDVQQVILRFDDHEQLYIDGACIDDDLLDEISKIEKDTELEMMVHPNSNTIMYMNTGSSVLLDFKDTSNKLAKESTWFYGLGLFCYALSLCGLISLLHLKKRKP